MADVESVNAVQKALENQGVIARMKSEMLSEVYKILLNGSRYDHYNTQQISKSHENKLVISCVRDVLENFGLKCTLSVFDAETKKVLDTLMFVSLIINVTL